MAIAKRKTGKYLITFLDMVPGTKLLVRSKEWWLNRQSSGMIPWGGDIDGYTFVQSMSRLCGKVVTVDSIRDGFGQPITAMEAMRITDNVEKYPYVTVVEEDGNPSEWFWTPGMFECVIRNSTWQLLQEK